MAKTLSIFILSILFYKIKSQAIEVNTNLQYSQFSYPTGYPFQTLPPTAQPIPPPVPVALPPQPCTSAPITQPPPPVSITIPTQPSIPPPTVTIPPPISIPFPQPVSIQPPTPVTFPAPLPTFQVSPPLPIFTPPVQVSPPPPIAIQEVPLNIPAFLPTVIPSPVVVSSPPISMISTTVVDNSLANKLANVLQLFLVSKTIESNINPYCNSPYFADVSPLYDAIGTIGTAYSPFTEIVTAPYVPAYGVDVVPSIFGVESFGTVTEVYPVGNIGAVSEVISYGDYYTSPFTQLAYNLPQIVEPAFEPIVYF